MQQPYNNQYQQQPQGQPQYQQQPQGQPQYQPQYQPPYQQPVYQAPKAPMGKKNLFALLVTCLFGGAALFELISMIGMCAKGGGIASAVIAYLLVIIGSAGFAVAPFLKSYAKLVFVCSAVVAFLGEYAITAISNVGVGYLFFALGVCALGLLCWLSMENNNLVRTLWFVPGAVILVGMIITLIDQKYFSGMSSRLVYYLFDLLFMLAFIGGSVILGLYLNEIHGEKAAKIKIPNPAPKPRAPKPQAPQYQQPYRQAPQGQPYQQAPQYQQPQPQQAPQGQPYQQAPQYQQPQPQQAPQYQQPPQGPAQNG